MIPGSPKWFCGHGCTSGVCMQHFRTGKNRVREAGDGIAPLTCLLLRLAVFAPVRLIKNVCWDLQTEA